MPRRTCVMGCQSPVRLHEFPCPEKDMKRRQKWMQALGLTGWYPRHIFACSEHFSNLMRIDKNLIKNAVPDINVKFETYIIENGTEYVEISCDGVLEEEK